jgi:thiol-disulfide isomerase/thioredoxin
MRALVRALWFCALLLGWAGPARASTEAAALLQMELWLDMGEHGMAVALGRRGTRKLPDDLGWHRAHLMALDAAGMGSWIEGEYVLRRAPAPAREAHACWLYEVGRTDELTVEGPHAAAARVMRALARKDWAAGEPHLAAVGPDLRSRWTLARAVASGDEQAVLQAIGGREPGAWRALGALGDWAPRKAARKVSDEALEQARSRASAADVTVEELLELALLWLDLEDATALAAVRAELERRSAPRNDLQRLYDAFEAGPSAWSWWDAPPRARWSTHMLDAVVLALAGHERPELPWARPDERDYLARRLAARLEAGGRTAAATRVLDLGLGDCGPSTAAWEALARDDGGAARAASLDKLLACLGSTELHPLLDPAGLDLVGLFERFAEAWAAHGQVAANSGRPADAALALGIAARLAPNAERWEGARRVAAEAGWAVEPRSGLPGVEQLVEAMEAAVWLRPSAALLSRRAEVARARTAALLLPTPERLAARSPSPATCVPTLRARCMLEWAVARAAFAAAGREPPPEFPEVADRGAEAAAASWLASLDTTWFSRRAELDRLVRRGDQLGLDEVLAAEVGVRVGRPAPPWKTPGVAAGALEDQVVVLAFWASWCGPCFPELAVLEGYLAKWRSEGLPVQVIAVGVDDDDSGFRKGLRRLHHDLIEVVHAPALRGPYRVASLPARVLIDRRGIVQSIEVGYDGGGLDQLDAAVRALAAAPAPR